MVTSENRSVVSEKKAVRGLEFRGFARSSAVDDEELQATLEYRFVEGELSNATNQ
jgi:hypothetical protein